MASTAACGMDGSSSIMWLLGQSVGAACFITSVLRSSVLAGCGPLVVKLVASSSTMTHITDGQSSGNMNLRRLHWKKNVCVHYPLR
jgi:hypothetical protein